MRRTVGCVKDIRQARTVTVNNVDVTDLLPRVHYDSAMRCEIRARRCIALYVTVEMCHVRLNPRTNARYLLLRAVGHLQFPMCSPFCSNAVAIRNSCVDDGRRTRKRHCRIFIDVSTRVSVIIRRAMHVIFVRVLSGKLSLYITDL